MGSDPSGYPPSCFVEPDRAKLVAFMRTTGMASFVTFSQGAFHTTALPLLVEERDGKLLLSGHMPKNNPQSGTVPAQCGLALFQGPQAYVRSNWYPSKKRDPRTTPTWDHISVRAQGPVETFTGQDALLDHLDRLSAHFESRYPDPWTISDAPAVFVERMANALIGFTMRVERLTGMWKMHQNHPLENRLGVIAGLTSAGGPGELAMAAAIEHYHAELTKQH